MKQKGWLVLASLYCLSSCQVGPKVKPLEADVPLRYTEEREEKTFSPDDEDLVGWWHLFNDPLLDQLIEEAIANNFDYRIALERVCQARAQYWQAWTRCLPEVDFDAQGSRYRRSTAFVDVAGTDQSSDLSSVSTPSVPNPNAPTIPAVTLPTLPPLSPIRNFFQLGFDAIWEIDLFGKFRRGAAAACDLWQAAQEDARDVRLIVLSEVAHTYVAICVAKEKRDIASQLIAIQERQLALAQQLFLAGIADSQSSSQQIASLATIQASWASLDATFKQQMYRLATLLGKMPETIPPLFEGPLSVPLARDRVPAGLPADLLRRRHDIRSAERQWAAATEQVGVAVAQLYPSLSLVGSSSSFAANPLQGANIGYSTDQLSKLFSGPARIWGIGGLLVLPMIDFGKRQAGVEGQVAIQHQAYLTFQKSVIAALQEVEESLTRYFTAEAREQQQRLNSQANEEIYRLNRARYEAGLANYPTFLTAESEWLSAQMSWLDSQQELTSALIALYKSLGGDW